MIEQGTRAPASADELAREVRRGLPLSERRLDLAGVSTPVLEGGDGAPLILLHGQGAFAESWGPVVTAFLHRRLVIPDLPGLGRSVVRGALDGPRLMAWLDALITATCTERPALAGISLGGAIAAHYGADHGERLRSIVLVDSAALGRFRPAPGALLALMRYLRNPSPAAFGRFARYALAHPEAVVPGADPAAPAAPAPAAPSPFVAYHVDRARQPEVRAANRRLVRWSMGTIPSARLQRIPVPVSLIWGREDRLMRFRHAERASARLHWPLYGIPDCGHVPFVDQRDAFVVALRDALEARS